MIRRSDAPWMRSRFLPPSLPFLLSFPAEVRPESGWQVQRSRSSFVRPSTPPCLPSKCSSGGGCVKYYDPSPLSPASVASRGEEIGCVQVAAPVARKASFREEEEGSRDEPSRAEPVGGAEALQLLRTQPEGVGTT